MAETARRVESIPHFFFVQTAQDYDQGVENEACDQPVISPGACDQPCDQPVISL